MVVEIRGIQLLAGVRFRQAWSEKFKVEISHQTFLKLFQNFEWFFIFPTVYAKYNLSYIPLCLGKCNNTVFYSKNYFLGALYGAENMHNRQKQK